MSRHPQNVGQLCIIKPGDDDKLARYVDVFDTSDLKTAKQLLSFEYLSPQPKQRGKRWSHDVNLKEDSLMFAGRYSLSLSLHCHRRVRLPEALIPLDL